MPDYDETTDPATIEAMQDADELSPADPYLYRGDAEKTAQVEEDAATRAELDHDQADELDPFHGNSGPGGPLGFVSTDTGYRATEAQVGYWASRDTCPACSAVTDPAGINVIGGVRMYEYECPCEPQPVRWSREATS